jgi:hypothetical protein
MSGSPSQKDAAMTATALAKPNRLSRFVRAVPVVGHMIRDVEREIDSIYYILAIFVTGVVLSIQAWGLPALVLAALSLVPVMFVLLVILARP